MAARTICVVISILASLMSSNSYAQAPSAGQFPKGPVRFIVPTAPGGGGSDFVARTVADQLAKKWGQSIVVENNAGAAGLIGLERAARSPADGHTIVLVIPGYFVIVPGKLSFLKGGDFTPLARVANTAFTLVVHPSLGARTVKEMIDAVKAKPGAWSYASSGEGTSGNLAMEVFLKVVGIDMTHVPYKGLGPAIPDLLAGRVHATMGAVQPFIEYAKGQRLRVLATTGNHRMSVLPDVPTFAEAGYPQYDMTVWFGIFGPSGIPAPIVATLNADINAAVQDPGVSATLTKGNIDPYAGISAAQFGEFVTSEVAKWTGVAKKTLTP